MKKGFTLAELLGVLVLLGLLIALVFPNLVEQVTKKQKEIEDSKLELIYSGAKSYCLEQEKDFPCTVSLSELDINNYIPFEIDEYKTDDGYGDYTCITVKQVAENKYSYEYKSNGC